MRFFVSTESEFPKIFLWLPKINEYFRRFPKISQRLLTITKGTERFLTTSKQGRQRFPKDFQPIPSIIKEFRRYSDDFSNVKKQLRCHFTQNWVFLHTLFLENEAQIDRNNYGMMLFMSKQVSLPKISSILQKMKIGQNSIYALFARRPSIEFLFNRFLNNDTRYCQLGVRN